MMGRALLWVLEVGWLAAWALHFGAGWDVAVMPLAAIAAAQVRPHGAWAVPAWILGMAAGALTGGWWGVFLVLTALWRGASPPHRDQPAVYERVAIALIGAAPLAIVAAAWAWTLPTAVALGLVAALDLNHDPATDRTAQLRVAGTLALVGAAAGVVVVGFVALLPLSAVFPLVRALLDGIGHVVAFLVSAVNHGRGRVHLQNVYAGRAGHPTSTTHAPATPLWVFVGAVVLAVGAVVLAVVALRRVVPPRRRAPGTSDEGRVEREAMDPARGHRMYGVRAVLTRRVVQSRMRHAERRRAGPGRGETVREWLGRVYGVPTGALASLYEEVRYGGAPDDPGRARTVQRHWPTDPGQPRDLGKGEG